MPLNFLVVGSALIVGAILLALARVLLQPASRRAGFARDYRTVDPARYRPMLRILDAAELDYIQRCAPPGSELAGRVKRRHIRLFREYLRALQTDFECLQHAGRQLVAQGAGQPSLAANLFQAHVQFSKSLWILRFRVAALQLGFGSVDARAILGAFEKASGALAQPAAA